MAKYLTILLLFIVPTCAQSQELDRQTAYTNKIKRVRIIYFSTIPDTVIYTYNARGLLTRVNQKANPTIYPQNASRVTSYYYDDTLLTAKFIQTYIGDTLFKTDSVLFAYDEYKRLVAIYSNYVDNVPILEINTYNDPKQNLNPSSLLRTSTYKANKSTMDTLRVPTVKLYNKTFYLQNFKVFSGSNINYYTPCTTEKPTKAQAFCKSKLDRVIVQGDSLRQTLTINGYTDLGFRNEMLFDDTAFFYFGDHNINAVTTERLSQGEVKEKNVFEYFKAYPTMCQSSHTSTFTYDSSGLVSEVKYKGVFYLAPNDNPIFTESKVLYQYTFYDR